MAERHLTDVIEILSCDLELRPRSAPGPDDLEPHILGVSREPGAVTIAFAREADDLVRDFVAAEQQCCSSLLWNLSEAASGSILKVSGTAEQLDALAGVFRTS